MIKTEKHKTTGSTSRRLGKWFVKNSLLRSGLLAMLTSAFLILYASAYANQAQIASLNEELRIGKFVNQEELREAGEYGARSEAVQSLSGARVEPVLSPSERDRLFPGTLGVQVDSLIWSLFGDSLGVADSSADSVSEEVLEEVKRIRTPWFAIKNNLLYDAVLTPNLTFEVKLAKHWTLQTEVGFNPFPLDDKVEHKWRHVLVDLEGKYWFCEAFHQGFIGVNAAYSHFNVAKGLYPVGWLYKDVREHRVQGDAVMAGVSGGWQWVVSKHVGIELEAGVDVGYAWFDRFECPHCGAKIDSPRKWFAVPKAGVNISILIPGEERDDCPCKKEQFVNEEFVNEEPVDTVAVDTIVPVLPVLPEPEPAPVLSAPERLQSRVLRSYKEYRPYSTDDVLSRDSDALYVYFPTDSFNLNRNFGNNGVIMDSILYLVSELMKDSLSEMKMIQIVGFASFDGPIKRNNMLAQGRAQALKDYIQENLEVPDSLFEVNNGGEAWAELEWAVEQSDYKYKDQVLKIIREEKSPYKRELKLKELNRGWVYAYLRDELLAKYRNAGYIKVYYDVPAEE